MDLAAKRVPPPTFRSTLPAIYFLLQQDGLYFNFANDQEQTDDGKVLEIAKTGGGYNPTPILLASFDGLNGSNPVTGVVANSAGNLLGTTASGGLHGDGAVFEVTGAASTPPPPPPTGSNDILLQNVSGQAAIWDVSGATLTSSALLGANPGPNWKDVGTGDFNDDRLPDILLQNTNGAIAIWETNGTSVTSSAVVANPGPNWHAIGTGDFNDDGHSDILLQNTNGAVAIWDMNGTNVADSAVVANPGANWKAVGTGDFNDDGHSDILLQNTNGAVAIWEMNGANGTTVADSAVVANPGAELEGGRNRRLQRRRPFRHPVAEHERNRCDLGDERGERDQQRRGSQSRAQLACDRNRRWGFRHPVAEHERPNRDLGHDRDQHHRQRRRERQRRAKLARRRADLIPKDRTTPRLRWAVAKLR